jgi:hypothetical protein
MKRNFLFFFIYSREMFLRIFFYVGPFWRNAVERNGRRIDTELHAFTQCMSDYAVCYNYVVWRIFVVVEN